MLQIKKRNAGGRLFVKMRFMDTARARIYNKVKRADEDGKNRYESGNFR